MTEMLDKLEYANVVIFLGNGSSFYTNSNKFTIYICLLFPIQFKIQTWRNTHYSKFYHEEDILDVAVSSISCALCNLYLRGNKLYNSTF